MARKKKVELAEGESYVPRTLQETIIYFADPNVAHWFFVALRWPEGVFCPFCGSPEHSFISTRNRWKCKGCKKQFSVRIGTIFEDSPISLSKWLTAIWLLTSCKNGISSYEIARDLDVTQKTAWFMLHRIRAGIKAKSFDKQLVGIVEADECHVGGLMKNMHKGRKEKIKGGRTANSTMGKTIVQAVLERDGEVRTQILESLSTGPRMDFLYTNVEEGSQVMTDDGYDTAQMKGSSFVHDFVKHQTEYVRGNVHCNGVENFWSLLSRMLHGTYVAVEPFHLSAYVDELAFRFNQRTDNDGTRFLKALAMAPTARLTWKDLTRAPQA